VGKALLSIWGIEYFPSDWRPVTHLEEFSAPTEDRLVIASAAFKLGDFQDPHWVAAGDVRVDGQHGRRTNTAGLCGLHT
jgi:hypothetical protein